MTLDPVLPGAEGESLEKHAKPESWSFCLECVVGPRPWLFDEQRP